MSAEEPPTDKSDASSSKQDDGPSTGAEIEIDHAEKKSDKSVLRIAVAGCSHGEMDMIYERLAQWEQQGNFKADLLICCGDYESIRNYADLECMAFYSECSIGIHLFHSYSFLTSKISHSNTQSGAHRNIAICTISTATTLESCLRLFLRYSSAEITKRPPTYRSCHTVDGWRHVSTTWATRASLTFAVYA